MEHVETRKLHLITNNEANDDALESVAARILPLPSDVTPSEEFLTRTRLRLLQLQPRANAAAARRAA